MNKSVGIGKLSRKEKRALRKAREKEEGASIPARKSKAVSKPEPEVEAAPRFWVTTAIYPKGPVRQVFPTQVEAERYAGSLQKRAKKEGFKDVKVTDPSGKEV